MYLFPHCISEMSEICLAVTTSAISGIRPDCIATNYMMEGRGSISARG
jgi:hypothetical protein